MIREYESVGGDVMCYFRMIVSIAVVLLLAMSFLAGGDVNAEETEASIQAQVEKEMPVLKGDTWVKMTQDSKIAFIWGAGHVVTIEQVLMQQYPELKRQSFVLKVAEAHVNNTMNMEDVAATVDNYYAENPDNLDMPVMHVIWDIIIKPNISTGIMGQPVN